METETFQDRTTNVKWTFFDEQIYDTHIQDINRTLGTWNTPKNTILQIKEI